MARRWLASRAADLGRARHVQFCAVLVMALTPAAGVIAAQSPAEASTPRLPQVASDNSLTFIPGKGSDLPPLYVVLPPCPATATHTNGTMTGPGFPAEGVNVIPTSKAGIRHDVPFAIPFQNALRNLARTYGVTLGGTYSVTVKCTVGLSLTPVASFSGTLTFTDPAHYTAIQPAAPPQYGFPLLYVPYFFPNLATPSGAASPPDSDRSADSPQSSLGASAGAVRPPASDGASAGPGGSASGVPGSAPAPVDSVAGVVADSSAPAGSTSNGSSGVGASVGWGAAGLALIAGAVAWWVRRRGRGTTPDFTEASRWPDQERV